MKIATIILRFMILASFLAPHLRADEREDRIRALEKRVGQLEKLLLEQQGSPIVAGEAQKPAGPTVSIGASGFTMRSADTNFALRIRGLLNVDSRWYVDDSGIGDNDGFSVRRARPILEGTVFRDFAFRFSPEFGGSSTSIRDAWVSYDLNNSMEVRFGKQKSPGGLERWQSASATTFVERSLVSGLWPVRDLGILLESELWQGDEAVTRTLGWTGLANIAVGIFNGAGDGRAAGNSDFDGHPTGAARLYVHPFLKSDAPALRTFGLGVSGTYGDVEGSAALPDDRGYTTEGQQLFFEYRSDDVIADRAHWRVGSQGYWYYGPFGLLGEYAMSSQGLRRETPAAAFVRANHAAWSVAASWLLTGEAASFRAVTPQRDFDPRAGGWGAWQLAARFSHLDIDDDVFPEFSDPATSARGAITWAIGLNWFLNRNVRASLTFNHTDFKGGDGGGVSGQDENVFLTRLQLTF